MQKQKDWKEEIKDLEEGIGKCLDKPVLYKFGHD